MKTTSDPGAAVSPADDEEWMLAMERQRALRSMTSEQLRAHLALQGWCPVDAKHAAMQRDDVRVHLVEGKRGLSTRITQGCPIGVFPEVPWHSVNNGHLRMLAHRIAGIPL